VCEALSYSTIHITIYDPIYHTILYYTRERERERKRERERERDAELAVNALGAGASSRLLTKLTYVNRLN
jgi:uncharacterized membrane protein